ncbi:MAG TPA: prepilin-type N-terminal cleavage/methylation domain-containing protein, partial [Desulfuromonadales bacterium]|nr:prepilin-type N-terminal cleavage/methylation domain-containing protein [Desulfuromonadales bacterium]
MRNGDTSLLRRVCCNKGFTLTELLVVTAIMAIVATGISSVFISTQRSTTSSEQVVDVQANLRVATSSLGRAIQNAGFLVRTDAPWEAKGIDEASSSATQLTLNTTLASGAFARISSVYDSSSSFGVKTDNDDMSEMFSGGDQVRIVRPVSRIEPDDSGTSTVYGVLTVDHSADPDTDPGQLVLDGLPSPLSAYFVEEDLIVKTRTDSTLNQKIRYWL